MVTPRAHPPLAATDPFVCSCIGVKYAEARCGDDISVAVAAPNSLSQPSQWSRRNRRNLTSGHDSIDHVVVSDRLHPINLELWLPQQPQLAAVFLSPKTKTPPERVFQSQHNGRQTILHNNRNHRGADHRTVDSYSDLRVTNTVIKLVSPYIHSLADYINGGFCFIL